MQATADGGLPWPVRALSLWPAVLATLPFVRRVTAMSSLSHEAVTTELTTRLGDGPFLGGRAAPSLADLSAYPQRAVPARRAA